MSNVVNILERKAHKKGNAKCLNCGHKWTAISEIDIDSDLECPKCELFRGVYIANCSPPEGSLIFICNCGCDHFHIIDGGIFCISCGVSTSFDDL